MKITLCGRTLEELRDALDFAVEQDSPEGRCCGIADWSGGTLEIQMVGMGDLAQPELRLVSADRQNQAYYLADAQQWQVLQRCDDCDFEEWVEQLDWDHSCRVRPRDNPGGWRE